MAVKLTPVKHLKRKHKETVDICNASWKAITAATAAYGEPVEKWNGFHDHLTYTPDQLRRMADRIEQIADAPSWLRWLADNGGAVLS